MVEILALAQEAVKNKGAEDARVLAELAVTGEADGTALIDQEAKIPTWRPRTYNTEETPVGKPYKWLGQVYKLWQQHDASNQEDWSPDKAGSLWDICHTTDAARAKPYVAPQGSRGLYQKGECCVWEGRTCRSKVANNAYSPGDFPDSWEEA